MHGLKPQQSRWRLLYCFLAATALTCLLWGCGGGGGNAMVSTKRVATWTSAQSDLNEDVSIVGIQKPNPSVFTNQTLRQIARASVGGINPRFKFSNRFGTSPLKIDKVRVAKSIGGGAIDVSTDLPVTFSGAAMVTIAAGQEVWSDPVGMSVAKLDRLAVSMYMVSAEIATAHRFYSSTTFVAEGDQTSNPVMSSAAANVRASVYYLSEVTVERTGATKVVVAFGDSITDGAMSTANAYLGYPEQLSDRALSTDPNFAVVNQGIAGNRWLRDRFGTAGITRFAWDALGVTGVTHVVVLLGINDLGLATALGEPATAEEIIGAMAKAISQAKAAGVKIYMGTIMPNRGTGSKEADRQLINSWIRANKDIAGVFDFDRALQDPGDPTSLLATYDSGDHLHPNDAGYARMASEIDLSKF